MTILPKRNKRRFESRDDSNQQINQTASTAQLEVQQTNHPVQLQLQLDQVQPRPLALSLNHPLNQAVHHSSGLNNHQQSIGRYSQSGVYHSRLHLPDSSHNHAKTSIAHPLSVTTSEQTCHWRRSPPNSKSSSTDECKISTKKCKRSNTKMKHPYKTILQENITAGTTTSTFVTYFPDTTTTASSLQNRQTHLTSTNVAALMSPKMLGGAKEKVCKSLKTTSSDNSEDENQDPPSPGGCNSEDEHMPSLNSQFSEELERNFEFALKKELGLEIKQIEMDGSCLFRAVADQVFGDQEMHDVVRRNCIDYMTKNADHFSHYVTEDFNTYLQRKQQLGCHGNHIEVQALSEIYNRPIEVYQYSLKPMNIFHASYRSEVVYPIRLTYHRNTHYNSLIDPNKPTVGVGLGLPGFKPRMVEQNLLSDVKTKSEDYMIEQAMLSDKLRETDWEITDETIQEQVAQESYLQWLEDCQKRNRRAAACTITGPSCSSGVDEHGSWVDKLSPASSPRLHSSSLSPKSAAEKINKRISSDLDSGPHMANAQASSSTAAPSSQLHVEPLTIFNYNGEIDESEAIARAIAESQEDYINNVIKKN